MIGQQILQAWNARDPDKVASLYAPDGVRNEIAWGGNRLVGRAAIAAGVAGILAAWPDCEIQIHEEGVCRPDLTVMEWTFSGTWEHDYGPLTASHERGDLRGVSVVVTEGDLIREERVYWDTATLMAAAGMLQTPT